MADDFYVASLKYQNDQLEAQIAEAQGQLRQAKANSDYAAGGEYGQRLANLNAEQNNLARLYNDYVASQTPRQPPELSDQEKLAKPVHRMNYGDVWEMAGTGKYGVDEHAFRAGMAEVQRRKARGE